MNLKSLEESLDKEFGLVNEGAFNESNVKRKISKITKFAEKSNTKKIVVKKIEKYEDVKKLKKNRRLKKLAAIVGVNVAGVASVAATGGKSTVGASFFNVLQWVIVFDSIRRRVGDTVGDKGVTIGLYNEEDKLQKMYIINTDLEESEIKSFLKSNSSNDITLESAEFNMEEALELSKAIYEELKNENIEFTLQEGILEELERDINDVAVQEGLIEPDDMKTTVANSCTKFKIKCKEKGIKIDQSNVTVVAKRTGGKNAAIEVPIKYKGKDKIRRIPIPVVADKPEDAQKWVQSNQNKYISIFKKAPDKKPEVNEDYKVVENLEKILDEEFNLN